MVVLKLIGGNFWQVAYQDFVEKYFWYDGTEYLDYCEHCRSVMLMLAVWAAVIGVGGSELDRDGGCLDASPRLGWSLVTGGTLEWWDAEPDWSKGAPLRHPSTPSSPSRPKRAPPKHTHTHEDIDTLTDAHAHTHAHIQIHTYIYNTIPFYTFSKLETKHTATFIQKSFSPVVQSFYFKISYKNTFSLLSVLLLTFPSCCSIWIRSTTFLFLG